MYKCTQRKNTQIQPTLHIFYAVADCYNITVGMICTCAGDHAVIHAVFYVERGYDHSQEGDLKFT